MFDFDMNTFYAGLKVMVFGLGGIFLVLIIFFGLIKLMMFTAKKVSTKTKK